MRARRSRRLGARAALAAASLAAVLYVFALDLGRTSPGPLSAAHAGVPELADGRRCDACHGGGAAMHAACSACHAAVGASLAGAPGFHADLGAADPEDCGLCHREHLGPELALVDALAFRRAGFASREEYDHRGLAFRPEGRHAELACAACHPRADAPAPAGPRFTGLDASCAGCHADPHQGRMVDACSACHSQARAFDDLSELDHPGRLPLEGAHAGLACAACHERGGPYAVEALSAPGPRPAARGCADCHADPHADGFASRAAALAASVGPRAPEAPEACAACHDARHRAFDAPDVSGAAAALHAASGFALAGPHARAACADCHGRAELAFERRFPGRGAADCGACHDDPHGDQFRGDAFAAGGCVACHAKDAFRPSTFDAADHGTTAFALEGAHARAACAACHAARGGASPGPSAAPSPATPRLAPAESPGLVARAFEGTPTDCAACHADPHERDGFAWAEPGLSCSACHGADAFSPARSFDHARATGFALEGAHAAAACDACHARSGAPGEIDEPDDIGRALGRASERFERLAASRGARPACASCHADPHAAVAWGGAAAPRPDCAACHRADGFAGAAAGFDHARWTAFALDGRHAALACDACHAPGGAHDPGLAPPSARERGLVPSATPRIGAIRRRAPGPAGACATCHADPHAGAFAGLAAEVAPRGAPPPDAARSAPADCARCHLTAGFELPAADFDHAWTGYPLEGPHAGLSCAACHAPLEPAPDPLGRRFERARGTGCADCHADPHAGQFAGAPGAPVDCARCHAGAGELAFDHARTRFALDERHARLACAACHVPAPLKGGGAAVRYRPLGTSCRDCHATGLPR